jgi:hypothetical protein
MKLIYHLVYKSLFRVDLDENEGIDD